MATIQQLTNRFAVTELARANGIPQIPSTSGALTAPTQDTMWSQAVIDETRWDKSFPYQLIFLKRVPGSVAGYARDMSGVFTLPIPPEALTISTPFAISTTVTLGGIVEEHNAAPIRMITVQGTTGHLPIRGSPFSGGAIPQAVAGAIFAGIVQGVSATLNPTAKQATNIISTASQFAVNSGVFGVPDNIITDSDVTGEFSHATGYYQFQLLKQFLEAYVNLKKTPDGRDYRLALAIWKDNDVYLVTPQMFELRRSAESPMEYRYSLAFKAWRRISGDELDDGLSIPPTILPAIKDPNQLGRALAHLQTARLALQNLKSVLVGFSSNVDAKVFQPLREVVAYCKDALGLGFTALDLPVNILQDLKIPIILAVASGSNRNFNGQPLQNNTRLSAEVQAIRDELRALSAVSGVGSTQNGPLAVTQQQLIQQLQGQFHLGFGETDPITLIFEDPDSNADLFSSFSLGSLSIQPTVNRKIITYKQNIRQMTRLDFETIRETLLQFIVDYSNFVGAGSAKYASNYGLLPPVATTRTPTDDDWELMFALNQAVIEVGRLAASTAIDDTNRITALEYVAALANQSGISFTVPSSKYAIPFPTGSTLEMVAARYLGDASRWIEIAALNNLRAPYVDEVGFNEALLTNGHGSDIQVSDSLNLNVNQSVWLQSQTVTRQVRHVVAIRKLSDAVSVLTLDGTPNLDQFTTAAGATLFSFLPQTVNSTQLLYLPSQGQPAQPDWQPPGNPNINPYDPLLQVGGVDLLLTNDNDIFMTPDGDSRYAVGLTNIIQRLRVFLSTIQGSSLFHPEYGLATQPGQSVADMTAAQILQNLRTGFRFDPTFTDISSASVVVAPPVTTITTEIGITGWNQRIPLSFTVNTNTN
jgi:hypothetical protein